MLTRNLACEISAVSVQGWYFKITLFDIYNVNDAIKSCWSFYAHLYSVRIKHMTRLSELLW